MKRSAFAQQIQPRNNNWPEAEARIANYAVAQGRDWLNSVLVEGHDVRWYTVRKNQGVSCSCRTAESVIGGQNSDTVVNPSNALEPGSTSFKITASNPFSVEPVQNEFEDLDITDDMEQDGPVAGLNGDFFESAYGEGVDCAVCMRVGMQPGYQLFNGTRLCLTTLSEFTAVGAHIRRGRQGPDYFEVATVPGAGVTFPIRVPKYTRNIRVACYMDKEIVATPSVANVAGATAVVITVSEFTHVVVEFDVDSPAIRVSLPQFNALPDLDKYRKLPAQNVIVGPQVRAQSGDLIWVTQYELPLKVTEVRPLYFRGVTVGQECNARIVQPLETLSLLPLT